MTRIKAPDPQNGLSRRRASCPLAPLTKSTFPGYADLTVAWSYRIGVRVAERRFLQFFNFADFDLPGTALNGLLPGSAGQINGTTSVGHNVDRVGVGAGVYSLGAPRQIEFALRVAF